jgi:hypothetical protein
MKKDTHPDYHVIDVKLTSTRRFTPPGPAAAPGLPMPAVACRSSRTNTRASASEAMQITIRQRRPLGRRSRLIGRRFTFRQGMGSITTIPKSLSVLSPKT